MTVKEGGSDQSAFSTGSAMPMLSDFDRFKDFIENTRSEYVRNEFCGEVFYVISANTFAEDKVDLHVSFDKKTGKLIDFLVEVIDGDSLSD
jgi:hypothetical protein